MSASWSDEERIEHLGRGVEARHAVLPGVAEVIDLPVLRPEHERAAKFVGKLIGIGVVYLVAGAIWTARGVAWGARWAWRRVRT